MVSTTLRYNLLTTQEAASILNVHENTLRRWCDTGIIPAFRIGPRGDRRVLSSDVQLLLNHMKENHGTLGIRAKTSMSQ